MKYKTTTKAVKNGCINVKYAGYCKLQHLLKNHEPNAYTCGIYGWNFDVYEVYGVTICTGYSGMPGTRLQGVKEYEQKARVAETPERVEQLLKEFCKLNGGYCCE